MKKIISILALMTLSLVAGGPFSLRVDPNDVRFLPQGKDTRIEITGYHNRSQNGGTVLPTHNFTYILPRAEKAKGVKILSVKTLEFAGEYDLGPTEPDPEPYKEGEFLPGSPLTVEAVGYQNGASMTIISFCPVIYEPKAGRVTIITDITFDIETEAAPLAGHPKISWWQDYEEYIEMLKGTVMNPSDVDSYAPRWKTVNKVHLTPSMALCSEDHPQSYPMISSALIIVPEDLITTESRAALDNFILWQRCSGRPLAWITYEWIYEHELAGAGGDSTEAMRNFLRNAHYAETSWGYTALWTAILVGDATTTAPVAYLCPSSTADPILSDYYFASLEADPGQETWDLDGDGRLGEADAGEGDAFFDLYVGRVPANTPQHLINWLEKQLYWESSSSAATQSALSTLHYCTDQNTPALSESELGLAAPVECDANPNGYMTYDAYLQCSPSIAVERHGHGYGFHTQIGPAPLSRPDERTRCMITNEEYRVYSTSQIATPSLSQINNHTKYSVAYPLNPYSCNFEDPLSIAAGYLTLNTDGSGQVIGSPICIGATGSAEVGPNDLDKKGQYLQKEFLKHIFQNVYSSPFIISPHSVGWGHYKAKEDCWGDRQECYSYNLFGAPWTCPWLGDKDHSDPYDQLYVDDIPGGNLEVGGFYTLHVEENDGNGDPVSDAILTTYQPQTWVSGDTTWVGGVIHSFNSIPPEGYVNIFFDPDDFVPGFVYITAVRYRGRIPSSNWNSQRPVQYIPSVPVQKTLDAMKAAGTDVEEEDNALPRELTLELENYNLGKEPLYIRFGNPASQKVKLSLYDATGRQVLLVRDEVMAPGWYERTLNLSELGLANGAYFIKLSTKERTLTEKVLLVR